MAESTSTEKSPIWNRVVKPTFFIALILVVVADLWTKSWAEATVTKPGKVLHIDGEKFEDLLVYKHIDSPDDALREDGIVFWDGVLHFKWAENFGAAFSIGEDNRVLLISLQLAILVGVLIFAYTIPREKWLTLLLIGMITGGALGNFYDRFFHETARFVPQEGTGGQSSYWVKTTAVRDFLYWPFDVPIQSTWGLSDEQVDAGVRNKWPIFNVADVCINVGVYGLILVLLFSPKPKEEEEEESGGSPSPNDQKNEKEVE